MRQTLVYGLMSSVILYSSYIVAEPMHSLPENAAKPPMVVSYAIQPITKFNRALSEARQAQAPWSESPKLISQRYSGEQFTLLSYKQFHNRIITYNVSQERPNHPQLLIILELAKTSHQGWRINKAGLSWRCKQQHVYSTEHCNMPASQAVND